MFTQKRKVRPVSHPLKPRNGINELQAQSEISVFPFFIMGLRGRSNLLGTGRQEQSFGRGCVDVCILERVTGRSGMCN